MNSDQLVAQFYELLTARDIAGLNAILAQDVVVTYHATPGDLPWAGRFVGVQGFAQFLAIVGEHLEIVDAERQPPFGDDHHVVVATRGRWRVKATGAEVVGSMLNIFSIAGTLITGYEVYADTAAFAKAMLTGPSAGDDA